MAGGFLDYVKRGLLEITVLHVIGSTQAPPASHYRCFAELKVYRFLLEYDAERSGSFQPLRFVFERPKCGIDYSCRLIDTTL